MTTQYTPILKLALPVTGELSGTWGDTVNDNITSMVEQAIAGLATISTWSANAHTLTTANGTTSESRCAMLVAQDGAGLAAAGQIICPAATKLYVLKNATSYTLTLKTSGGTGVAVTSGDTAFLFCDGTNVNACVTTIVNGHITGNLTVDGNATVNGNTTLGDATSDTVTFTARVASNVLPSADNTYDLGSAANSWKSLWVDGTATMALVAISGGTIDGVSIGATTPATFLAVDNLTMDVNTIASTNTNGNIILSPNGTGDVYLDADTVRVGDANAAATLTSNGTGALTVTTGGAADLTLSTNSGTNSGTITITNGANGNITLTPNGTGDVILSADTAQIGDLNTDAYLTTNGTGNLNLTTNNGTNSGTIQIAQGANGNITLTPNGTGSVSVPKFVWSGGTSGRVPYLTTGGQITDSANMTFNGTTLTVAGFNNTGNETIGASSANTLTINATITSNLLFTDNTFDIGQSGANRPRNIYIGTNSYVASGASYVNTTTPTNNSRGQQFIGIAAGYAGGAFTSYGGTVSATRPIVDLQRSRGSVDQSFTAVQNGDYLGTVMFRGSTGSGFNDGAEVSGIAEGTWTTTSTPTRLSLFTIPTGGNAVTERLRIGSDGVQTWYNAGSTTGQSHMQLNLVGLAVGQGITANAWGNQGPAIQLAYGGLYQPYFSTNNSQVLLTNNIYQKQDTTFAYMINTNKGSVYRQIEGQHQFLTAPSSAGPNTSATLSQVLTILSNGYVGVATSNPNRNFQVYDGTNAIISSLNASGPETVLNATTSVGNVGTATSHPLTISTAGLTAIGIDTGQRVYLNGAGALASNILLSVYGQQAWSDGTNAIYIGNGGQSFSFNRNPSTGGIYNSSSFSYQWQRTISTTAASDYLGLQVYNTSATQVTSTALTINGNGYTGVGTSAQTERLVVDGCIRSLSNANNFNTVNGAVMDYNPGGGTARFGGTGTGSVSNQFFTTLSGSNRICLEMSAAGQITTGYQAAFQAYASSSSTPAAGATVPFDATTLNRGSYYNTGTYTFTAPVSGLYFFNVILTNGLTSQTVGLISLYVNGNRTRDMYESNPMTGSNTELHSSATIYLNANDQIKVVSQSGGTYVEGGASGASYYSMFTGYLIG